MRGVGITAAVLACAAAAAGACSSSSGGGGESARDAGAPDSGPIDPAIPPMPPPPPDTTVHCETDKQADGLYQHLQCAGLYTDIHSKTLAAGLRSYTPALVLWADGAEKNRWLDLPAGQKIDTTDPDEWIWPVGTRVWKEFQYAGRRYETRLYTKNGDGVWQHTAYVWNVDGSDAVRNDGGKEIPPLTPDGTPYEVPSGNECNSCHAGKKDKLLGLEGVNLGLPGAQGITLASLVADDLVTVPFTSTTVAFPEDATGKAADALAWLHVSCGPCHNRSGDSNASNSNVRFLTYASDLAMAKTVDQLDAFLTTVDKPTSVAIPDAGGADFQIIERGDPSSSLASWLSGRRVPPPGMPTYEEQMPPIVTRVVDTTGHAKLDAWISALP
ncbi:MAG TPA: hypothetical protein VIF62_30805 [Labilithrix sp.]|jgi:hypothetical protein